MKDNYLYGSSILAVLIALLNVTLRVPYERDPVIPQPFPTVPECSCENVEHTLALGYKAPLQCMDQVDLELIPGVSSLTALTILNGRDRVLKEGKSVPPERAFQVIHGIGEQKGRNLAKFISLPAICGVSIF